MSTPPAAATSPKSEKSPAKDTGKSPSKSPSKSPPQHAQVNVGDTGILEPTHWQQLAEVRYGRQINMLPGFMLVAYAHIILT